MVLGGDHVNIFQADAAHFIGYEHCRAADVFFMLRRGAHAGDAEQVF
jgi:hypothetical protein